MKFFPENINSSNTWQIGTGNDTRAFFDVFVNYGVALVGPGNPGREGEELTAKYYKEHSNRTNWGAVLKQVKKGEWIIARKGKGIILGMGQVFEEYNYSNLFSDIDGWDLQHYIKVSWKIPKTENHQLIIDSYSLGMSTLQRCHSNNVFNAIYSTEFEDTIPLIDPITLEKKQIIINDIVDKLVDEGVRIQDAENVGAILQRIIRLATYYINYDDEALEAETVAFLIIPFLIALGWSEQKIKLQYSFIDVAIFKEAFGGDYKLCPKIILEAKQFHKGLEFTSTQIKTYSDKFPDCNKFIATNGSRYKYFEKENGELVCKGYFNLLELTEMEVLKNLPLGSVETLLSISNFY